jgi:RimJ/RimL family protein N-acetyltransferase
MNSTVPRRIETDRLVLDAVEPRHGDPMFDAAETCRPYLAEWLDWAATSSRSGVKAFAKDSARNWNRDEAYTFVIKLAGEVIGVVDLRRDSTPNSAEMGYWMREDVSGRGYMTEAARALIEMGFATLGLHRIHLFAGVDNHASRRVAEKLGFQREGLARHGSRAINGYYDVYLYGLLETDPRAPRR